MIDIWEFANARKVKIVTKTQVSPDFIIGFTPDEIEEIIVIE